MDALMQNLETLSSSAEAAARASFEQYCESLEAEYTLKEKEFDQEIDMLDALYQDRLIELQARESGLLEEQHQDIEALAQLFYDK